MGTATTLSRSLATHDPSEPGHAVRVTTLALEASGQGIDTVIVTADRDFFQLVRPGITVMFNVKGISDIRLYDVEADRIRP